jgi:hypothetical protein
MKFTASVRAERSRESEEIDQCKLEALDDDSRTVHCRCLCRCALNGRWRRALCSLDSLRSHFAVLTHVAVRRVRRGGERNSFDGRVCTRARDLAPVQLPVRRVHLRDNLRARSVQTRRREGRRREQQRTAQSASAIRSFSRPSLAHSLDCVAICLLSPPARLAQTTCGSRPCGGCRRWWREVLMAATFRLPPRPTARAWWHSHSRAFSTSRDMWDEPRGQWHQPHSARRGHATRPA